MRSPEIPLLVDVNKMKGLLQQNEVARKDREACPTYDGVIKSLGVDDLFGYSKKGMTKFDDKEAELGVKSTELGTLTGTNQVNNVNNGKYSRLSLTFE